jgi:hypothetical protein
LYRRFLERVNPEVVVLIVGYSKETLIEVCKEKNITVVELQHGIIYSGHFGYSYSGDRTKDMFPDYLLTWGEFWSKDVEFPIPDDYVIPVGYPYLEKSRKEYNNAVRREQILFISQGTIGEQLSKFALEVEQHPNIDYNVIYKLHPGEYDRWRKEYPWLINTNIRVIDNSGPSLYNLFDESRAQVGVGSSAIYEGLAFELETYVYDCPGSEALQPLIDDGSAKLISSSDELVPLLGENTTQFDREYYFRSNATEVICETLKHLME